MYVSVCGKVCALWRPEGVGSLGLEIKAGAN